MKLYELFDPKLAYHDTLNPKIWDQVDGHYKLKVDVAEALDRISSTFAKTLGVDTQYIVDIVLTGSNANFNWTALSDLDVHLMVDMENLECDDCKLDAEGCMQAKKSLWNASHDVTIYGHDVEVYVCNAKDDLVGSAAAYSLINREWIQEPSVADKQAASAYSSEMVQLKADQLAHEIDQAIETHADDEATLEELNNKLYKMRSAGLSSEGEHSLENLTFKALRNNGYVQRLRKQIVAAADKSLSLEESLDSHGPVDVIKTTSSLFVAKAEFEERDITLTAELQDDEFANSWDVSFKEQPNLNASVLRLNRSQYGKTGSGQEFKVFAFVLAAIQEFIERYSPELVTFTSSKFDGARSSLYKRMLNKMLTHGPSSLRAYKLSSISDIGTDLRFVIERK